jgi:HopA1 effector protein family
MRGYYCTWGGRTAQPDFRVYFAIKAQCAAWFLQAVTEKLEERGANYQFKLLNHPRAYTRPDVAVLYMNRNGIEDCRWVLEILATVPSAFRAQTPTFARAIYRGIAVADEPPAAAGGLVSFGEHRSRIVARGLARAHAEGGLTMEQRVQAIYREFESHGLDASRPYSATSGGIAEVF